MLSQTPTLPVAFQPERQVQAGWLYRRGSDVLTLLDVPWFIFWWLILAIDDARQAKINRDAGEGESDCE